MLKSSLNDECLTVLLILAELLQWQGLPSTSSSNLSHFYKKGVLIYPQSTEMYHVSNFLNASHKFIFLIKVSFDVKHTVLNRTQMKS